MAKPCDVAATPFPLMRALGPRLFMAFLVPAFLATPIAAQTHNYSEAFQKALFFYEAQTSGDIPLDHRAEWRGPSATRDGSDVGRDLSGGWYDAGDGVVWTGNDCFGAMMLSWSVVRHRDVYISTGQYAIALDRLREISGYFKKIVQFDANGDIERLYCGKGTTRDTDEDPSPDGTASSTSDNDRSEGCPNEVMDTTVGGSAQAVRPSYWVDSHTGGADVAGALAYACASLSIALRNAGDTARADEFLALAKKVYAWGEANPNKTSVLDHNGNTLTTGETTRRLINGDTVTLSSYSSRQSDYVPRMLLACAWLHRADRAAATSGYTSAWIDKAENLYNSATNADNRSKAWVSFASGSEQNGAYCMLASDSGRASFVAEANNYAKFWVNDRSAHTGRTTDPTTTPDGFIARLQSPGWNIQILLDQAPPLLDWADSAYIADITLKSRLIALYTGTYTGANGNECPVKQLDYILGSNSLKLSYLAGYKPSGTGYDWVKNLHYRSTWFRYGGFGTPADEQPEWNTAIPYGTLAPGPDHTDFYPTTKRLTEGTSIGHQEPVIYTGGLLTVLARNIALGGPSAGAPLATFPVWETRPSDYQTRSFFVRASKDGATKFQCYVNNRASLPPREINTLGFRYYFTPDGVAGSAVSCTATGSGLLSGESIEPSGPFQVGSSSTWYFEFKLKDAMIVPGEYSRYRRKVQLEFTQPTGTFDPANDHSGSALSATEATIGHIPVYDTSGGTGNWKLLGGFEPSAGYIQWRRAHFNNTLESATSVTLIAERVGGSTGAVSATVTCAPGTATAADYTAPVGPAAILSWADGESGEKAIAISLTPDGYKEDREYFTANLGSFSGSAAAGITTSARVSIEDDDFNGTPDPGSLVQIKGGANNVIIADGDSTPATDDGTDFGPAATGAETSTRTFTVKNLDSTALALTGSPAIAIGGAHASDFTVTGTPATSVPASDTTTFEITFSPSANGERSATITVANNKSTSGFYAFTIKGTGVGAKPSGSLTPSSVARELKPGGGTPGTATQTLTLANSGRADLPWTASLPAKYVAITSGDAGGPAYNWIDITTPGASQGTVITAWVGATVGSNQQRDDYISTSLNIGFNFPYHGSNKTQLRVSTNGFLTFDTSATSTGFNNMQLPSTAIKAPTIAPWWDDLYLKANQGDIYCKRVDADTFVVTWHRVSYYNYGSPTGDMSFQVILKRNGQIICQYKNVMSPVDGTGYTLGIQNSTSDAAQACQHAYNTKTAENGIAIEFRPPPGGSYDVTGTSSNWAALSTASGTVAAMGSGILNISFSTTGLQSGQSYPTQLAVSTPDDPARGSYTVPITLTARQAFNLKTEGTGDRAWETPSNWNPNSAFPGPNDDLVLTTAGGSLRIDGPRTIRALTLDKSTGLTLTGSGFGGSGTGATLTLNGLLTVKQGAFLVGGSTAKLQLNGGLRLAGGTLGFAGGANGSIALANDSALILAGGILDTLVNTSGTIYRQALGTGDLGLEGTASEIAVSADIFTLDRRLTGSGGFKKVGAGTLLLNGASADNAGTVDLVAGTLKLGANNPVGSGIKLSGGTLAANGKTLAAGTLQLSANSTIDFTGGGTLVLADSSALAWGDATLALTNFDPATCSIRFGNSASGLTAAQIAKITLNGTPFPLASLNADGYLDNAAPSWFSGWPKADNATSSGCTLRAQINERGTCYYVVLASGATAPDAAEVKAGTASGGAPATATGSIALSANAEGTATVTGLADNTAYDVYFVAQDVVPNTQPTPAKVSITTTALSYIWGADTAGNWSETANWTPSGTVPDERDITVTFGPVVTAARTITLNTPATIGRMVFNEDAVAANSYTLAIDASQTLTFDVTSGNATLEARSAGGYALGSQGLGAITLSDTLAISAGASGSATSDAGTIAINSKIIGTGGLVLSSLASNDGSGTAPNGARGTFLRSTAANDFSGGVTVDSGYVGISGNIGNLGSGTLTLNASDSSNGGIGTTLNLRSGGGTLTNNIVLGNPGATGGGNPRLSISLSDSAQQSYTFTGTLSGNLGNQTLRFATFSRMGSNTSSTLTLAGDGSALTSSNSGVFQLRTGGIILSNANALGAGNTVGTTNSGGLQMGNFSSGSTGTNQVLTAGFNVGSRITSQAATAATNTSGDTLIVGGEHTNGTAIFSGTVSLARIVGGSRTFQLTSAASGTTVFSGVISDGAISGSASTAVPVEKVGAGIVNLTASNTYSGGTTLKAGTLLVNNAAGSGTGTGSLTLNYGTVLGGTGFVAGAVNVSSGGSLAFSLAAIPAEHDKFEIGGTLTFGGSNTLAITAGESVSVGTYTLITAAGGIVGALPALSLPAGWSAILQTSGNDLQLVVVSTGLTPLQNWRQSHFGTAANSGNAADSADADGDGLPNLVEYALGSSPTNPGSTPPPVGQTPEGFLELTFTPQVVSGLSYFVEVGNDLTLWSQTEITSLLMVGQPHTYTDHISPASQPNRFLRLKISTQ